MSGIINLSVGIQSAATPRTSFGIPLILDFENVKGVMGVPALKTYSSLDEMKADDMELRHAAAQLRADPQVRDRLMATLLTANRHTLAALEAAAEALSTLLNGQAPELSTEADVPLACVKSQRPTPEAPVEVTACVALVSSHGAGDPANATLMKAQLEDLLDKARLHAAVQQKVLDALEGAVSTEQVQAAVSSIPQP